MGESVSTRWLTREDCRSRTVSYSQNHEDILLYRVFDKKPDGFYIDIGANDPVFHSVTKLLYEKGWHGINVEPTPLLSKLLEMDRPRDITLNVGVSDTPGEMTFFEVAPPLHGWSTFMPELAESYKNQGVIPTERTIPVQTLDMIFQNHAADVTVDVLKVDVEGLERQVLSSVDLGKWRPKVILVEAAWRESWEHLVLQNGYLFAAFDGINRYYVRQESAELLPLFEAPVNILDNFIPYEVLQLLEQEHSSFGPHTILAAKSIQRFSKKYARLSAFLKKTVFRPR
jgi:FkbM family methyltransferase